MPIQTIDAKDKPARRFQNSMFYSTQEWNEVMRVLKAQKLPTNKALRLVLSPETLAKLPSKRPYQSFFRALARYCERMKWEVTVELLAGFQGEKAIYISHKK